MPISTNDVRYVADNLAKAIDLALAACDSMSEDQRENSPPHKSLQALMFPLPDAVQHPEDFANSLEALAKSIS